jgi:alanine racemase
VPRLLSNRGAVAIGGVRCPIAGRVAMDQFVVDAGDLTVALGDEIVLFGPGDAAEPTVEEWAAWAQTNPHEILTGIGARVPRTYVSASEPGRVGTQASAHSKEQPHD